MRKKIAFGSGEDIIRVLDKYWQFKLCKGFYTYKDCSKKELIEELRKAPSYVDATYETEQMTLYVTIPTYLSDEPSEKYRGESFRSNKLIKDFEWNMTYTDSKTGLKTYVMHPEVGDNGCLLIQLKEELHRKPKYFTDLVTYRLRVDLIEGFTKVASQIYDRCDDECALCNLLDKLLSGTRTSLLMELL